MAKQQYPPSPTNNLPHILPPDIKEKFENDILLLPPDHADLYTINIGELSKTTEGMRVLATPQLLEYDATTRMSVINNAFYMESKSLEALARIMKSNPSSQEAMLEFNETAQSKFDFLTYVDKLSKSWDYAVTHSSSRDEFITNHDNYFDAFNYEEARKALESRAQRKDLQRLGSVPPTEHERIAFDLSNDPTLKDMLRDSGVACMDIRFDESNWELPRAKNTNGKPFVSPKSKVTLLAHDDTAYIFSNARIQKSMIDAMQTDNKRWVFHFSEGRFNGVTQENTLASALKSAAPKSLNTVTERSSSPSIAQQTGLQRPSSSSSSHGRDDLRGRR